jgi:selenocysteine lyase/cysteine desulfurase
MDPLTHLWNPDTVWLNTAQYGLPPATAYDDLAHALRTWSRGTGDVTDWGRRTEDTRANLARLVGATPDDIALGATTSQLVATVATALPDGARVLAPEGDYTSLTFPFAAQAHRGVRLDTAPLPTLAEHIGPRTHTVAFSLVQSATGRIAPVKDILAAARTHRARTVVDATQAAGWLPLHAPDHDAVIASAYKWLMAPRGLAFAYLAPHLRPDLRPLHAGPSAAADPHASFYTDRMELADTARALDISPNWFASVAAARSTATLLEAGVDAVHAHNTALADRLRAHLGLPPARSAITTVEIPGAHARLARAGIATTERAGRTRLAFHLYNTARDADRAADALT